MSSSNGNGQDELAGVRYCKSIGDGIFTKERIVLTNGQRRALQQVKAYAQEHIRDKATDGILAWELKPYEYFLSVKVMIGDKKLPGLSSMIIDHYSFCIKPRGGFVRKLTYHLIGSKPYRIPPYMITGHFKRQRVAVKCPQCNGSGLHVKDWFYTSERTQHEDENPTEDCWRCSGRGRILVNKFEAQRMKEAAKA